MASKFGKAWKAYKKELSKHGKNLESFPNPDESQDKSFVSTGVYKMWSKKDTKLKKSDLTAEELKEYNKLKAKKGKPKPVIKKKLKRKDTGKKKWKTPETQRVNKALGNAGVTEEERKIWKINQLK